MKRFIILGFCFIFVGCESVQVAPGVSQETMSRRFISTSLLHRGLSRGEVSDLLGKEIVIGYELVNNSLDRYKPITIGNPQRSETISNKNRNYVVDYYVVGVKIADNKISDDELVPVIFYNGRLVGTGWDFFNKHVKGQ